MIAICDKLCFRPDLECLVGVDSADTSELYKVNCNNAWNISVKLDKKKANIMFAENYISDQDRIRRIVRCVSSSFIPTHLSSEQTSERLVL